MPIDKLFDTIAQAREQAQWQAAFGEPQEVEGQVVIPVAQVGYRFGLGFGQREGAAHEGKEGEETEGAGEGGGGGGGATTRPVGALVVKSDQVHFVPTMDLSKISMAGIALGALVLTQIFMTLRAVLGRD